MGNESSRIIGNKMKVESFVNRERRDTQSSGRRRPPPLPPDPKLRISTRIEWENISSKLEVGSLKAVET